MEKTEVPYVKHLNGIDVQGVHKNPYNVVV